MRWRQIYAGALDHHSAVGVAGASWHTFDKRVWESGDCVLTLIRDKTVKLPHGKGRAYRVVVLRKGVEVFNQTGFSWIALCKAGRASVD